LQSEEFVKLSQIEKFYAYNLYDDMQALRNHVRYATEQHEQRLLNLAQRLLSTPATDKLRRFLASAHQQQLALPLDTTDPDQDTSRGRRGR